MAIADIFSDAHRCICRIYPTYVGYIYIYIYIYLTLPSWVLERFLWYDDRVYGVCCHRQQMRLMRNLLSVGLKWRLQYDLFPIIIWRKNDNLTAKSGGRPTGKSWIIRLASNLNWHSFLRQNFDILLHFALLKSKPHSNVFGLACTNVQCEQLPISQIPISSPRFDPHLQVLTQLWQIKWNQMVSMVVSHK